MNLTTFPHRPGAPLERGAGGAEPVIGEPGARGDDPVRLREADAALGARLARCLDEAPVEAAPPASAASPATEPEAEPAAAADGHWHISLRFDGDVLRAGLDPLAFVRCLNRLGRVEAVETVTDALPEASELDPESNYLGFEVGFRGAVTEAQIEEVFEFVRDSCRLTIFPPGAAEERFDLWLAQLPEGPLRGRELLAACGTVPARRAAVVAPAAAPVPVPSGATAPPAVAATADAESPSPPAVAQATAQPAAQAATQSAAGATVRIDAARLDELINLVGELVIGVAGGDLLARRAGIGELVAAHEGIARLVEDIRDTALRLRMVPIGETFRRFQRVVRDGAHELGKKIELVVRGGDAELDKVVAERVGDPLLHLVRNAMDHGLEGPAERLAAGKPEVGRLSLEAYYDSGSIVIEVADDGRGLSRGRILARAVERGLLEPSVLDQPPPLPDRDLFRLIFEAGFSTAEQVSKLSGRGVGMDVVRRNIEALRGTVELESREGAGCRVRIRLPLTLSIIDGFLLRVGRTRYVVPLDMIVECIELADCGGGGAGSHGLFNLRGEVLPYLRMGELFHDRRGDGEENIVVVRTGGHKAGLVVDELLGGTQTVIKPLGPLFRRLRGISGSTILGSGEVALILDVPELVHRAVNSAATGFRFGAAGRAAAEGEFVPFTAGGH
ncbi:chemotaxis protein CheA [Endothiovibrio diazotrophicus]